MYIRVLRNGVYLTDRIEEVMDAGAQPIFLVAPYGHPYEKNYGGVPVWMAALTIELYNKIKNQLNYHSLLIDLC